MANLKNIMTRAWEIAKEAVVNYGGKAVEYIAGAMKMAWAETKVAVDPKIIRELEVKGAKRWSKGSHDRLYLNRAGNYLANIKVEYNKKGKWQNPTLDGEYLSNRGYGKVTNQIYNAYIDLKTGILELYVNYNDDAELAERVILSNLAKLAKEY